MPHFRRSLPLSPCFSGHLMLLVERVVESCSLGFSNPRALFEQDLKKLFYRIRPQNITSLEGCFVCLDVKYFSPFSPFPPKTPLSLERQPNLYNVPG